LVENFINVSSQNLGGVICTFCFPFRAGEKALSHLHEKGKLLFHIKIREYEVGNNFFTKLSFFAFQNFGTVYNPTSQ
jgi:hypothetical protein